MTRNEALIALNMMAHVGPVRVRKLLEVFEEPQRILQAKEAELSRVEGLPRNTIEAILNWENDVDLQGELERIRAIRRDRSHPRRSDFILRCCGKSMIRHWFFMSGAHWKNGITTRSALSAPDGPPTMAWSVQSDYPIRLHIRGSQW